MNPKIKPLTPELHAAYLEYFDDRAFAEDERGQNGSCYCSWPTQTTEEKEQMMSEFSGGVKVTLRRYAEKMLGEGRISGYLAFDGDTPVGWVNAGDMGGYPVAKWPHIPNFARENAVGRTTSVVCFSIAPDYRGKGVASALLERVIADARVRRYAAVEGYIHGGDYPVKLFEKLGFTAAYERGGEVVMRKIL